MPLYFRLTLKEVEAAGEVEVAGEVEGQPFFFLALMLFRASAGLRFDAV